MTKKTRYFLIILCVAAFLILAPFVILYVKGVTYDTGDNTYSSTGLLSIRTDPKNVQIFLNDERIDETPADLRFLKTGGYNVRLQKEGYRTWTKRIEVAAGKVSWASPTVEKIVLFYETPETAALAEGVVDFQKLAAGWLYLMAKNLVVSGEDGKAAKNFVLPKPVNRIASSAGDRWFLLTGEKSVLLFDAGTNTFKDISQIFKDVSTYDFDLENNLWLLKNSQLIKLDTQTLRQTVQAKNVAAFYLQDNNPYYIQKSAGGEVAGIFLLSLSNGKLVPQPVATGAPVGKATELAVTNQKEIFVLADHELYRINESSQKLQSGVLWWQYDPGSASLVFATGSELDFYNFFTNEVQLITRSGSGFANTLLYYRLGYIFYRQSGQLIAAELDTFDHQNTYSLSAVSENSKFSLDSEARQIYLLDKGKLQTLIIR